MTPPDPRPDEHPASVYAGAEAELEAVLRHFGVEAPVSLRFALVRRGTASATIRPGPIREDVREAVELEHRVALATAMYASAAALAPELDPPPGLLKSVHAIGRLAHGDVVHLALAAGAGAEEARNVAHALKAALPNARILVTAGDVELNVQRADA